MVVAFLTGHTPVQKHLNFMGLFNGNLDCRYCKMDTEKYGLIQGPVTLCERHQGNKPMLKL